MDVTDTRLGPLLLLLIGLAIHSTDAYTKYGRTCKDIGCPPSEMCTMAVESCSYSQREGKDCGSYPTCSRNPNGRPQSPDDGGSSTSTGLDNSMPAHRPPPPPTVPHDTPAYNAPNNNNGGAMYPQVNPGGYTPSGGNGGNNPYSGNSNGGYGSGGSNSGGRPSSTSATGSIGNFFNSLSGGGSSGSGSSTLGGILSSFGGGSSGGGSGQSSGLGSILGALGGSGGHSASSGNSGLSSILGALGGSGGGGGSSSGGLGSLFNQFTGGNGGGGNRADQQPHGNGGGGGGSSLLSGLGGMLASQLIQNAIKPRNGDANADGITNRRYLGLFNENPSTNSGGSAGPKAYPTQPPVYSDFNAGSRQPDTRSNKEGPHYGWNV